MPYLMTKGTICAHGILHVRKIKALDTSNPNIPVRAPDMVQLSDSGKKITRAVLLPSDEHNGQYELWVFVDRHSDPLRLQTERKGIKRWAQPQRALLWVKEYLPYVEKVEIYLR